MRNRVFVRQWQVLVALRRNPRTMAELAMQFDVCERTIRRDLETLQAVPFPLVSAFRGDGRQVWGVLEVGSWPRTETMPIRELSV